MNKGFAWKIILWMLMAPGIVLAAASAPVTPETVQPIFDPIAADFIIKMIISMTAQFPWGIWVMVGFTALGMIATVARIVVQLTPGDRDDYWVEKIFGWIPVATTLKKANKILGKGKINLPAIKEILERHKHAIEEAKKAGAKLGSFAIVFLLIGIMAVMSGCPKQTDSEPLGPTEQIAEYLDYAEGAVNAVERELPNLYKVIDKFCGLEDPPDWCAEVPTIKKDMTDSIAATKAAIKTARKLLDTGNYEDVQLATGLMIDSLDEILDIYIRILNITNRHE